MRSLKSAIFAVTLSCFAGNAFAGAASDKLSVLADSLIKDYAGRVEGSEKRVLAIFPFNSDNKLEKQRVGFAVSELMSHRFVANGDFSVVERAELAKLLKEQKLQASGIVDGDAAVKIGKVMGATVLLVGNVHQVGRVYQVNARLINAETAAVVASGYAELDAAIFAQDGRNYLVTVPEVGALGLYFLYQVRHNYNSLPTQTFTRTTPGIPNTATVDPLPFDLGLPGFGIRYSPSKRLVVDLARASSSAQHAGRDREDGGSYVGYEIKVSMTRLLLSRKKTFGNFSGYAGAGITSYSITDGAEGMRTGDIGVSYVTPTAALRLDYSPQERIGLGISGVYDIASKTAGSRHTPSGLRADKAELTKFFIEASLAVYF